MILFHPFFMVSHNDENVIIVRKRRRRRWKLQYICFLLSFLHVAVCEKEWSPHELTYENIFNTTNYAQLQLYTSYTRPQNKNNLIYVSNNPVNKYFIDRPKEEGLEQVDGFEINNNKDISHNNQLVINNDDDKELFKVKSKQKRKLLVGFSHDPYRLSIPEDEFVNGGRSSTSSSMNDRGKRGVSHLYNMIQCATGCDPLIFKGYGCYCGFLGSGRYTDPIDRCCKMHDQCYENIYCPLYTVYLQPYYWTCFNREPLCAIENHFTRNNVINGCAGRLCECDRLLAMCLRRYRCPRSRALCRSSPLRLLQNIIMIP